MSTKETVLGFLEKNKGKFVSGETMATTLQVSRNAIWKSIQELRNQGYIIEASSRNGYCLKNEIFSIQSIEARMKHSDFRFELYKELDSTNRLAKQKGEQGEPEGLVILSDRQTNGRGRKGRNFFSPDSGLYMSLLLRPHLQAEDALLITTAAAVAIAQAIKEVFNINCEIKWVNDLYVNEKKVCGILTEAAIDFEGGSLSYAVLGIGINLSDPADGFPAELQNIATSLLGTKPCTVDQKSRLIAEICHRFFCIYQTLPQKDFMEEYRRRSFLIGKPIQVLTPTDSYPAQVLYVDENAHLVIELSDGSRKILSSGDVSVRRF